MIPFKKIVCPTDFSEPSYEALKAANELAVYFRAELVVVHVVPPIPTTSVAPPTEPGGWDISGYRRQLDESSRRSLDEVVKERVAPEVQVRPMVVEGDAAYQIVKIAEEEGADLVVIATHGHTGLRHLVFGSVAEKVVRLAPCPVLTIHPPRQ